MPITRRKRANPPDQPENNNHVTEQAENPVELPPTEQSTPTTMEEENFVSPATEGIEDISYPIAPPSTVANGDRIERQDYAPPIESGRRTARGELFRRPPQPPVTPLPPAAASPAPPLHAPTREIMLPLGNLLHLAYNPGYTGSDDARSILLNQLANESKAGGRARCWNCGSIAIAYDRWNTRSKTFGEVGVAFCEICGVWSVL